MLAWTCCLLLLGAALPSVFGLATAEAAKTRSPCEDGVAVGQICHYVAIVSEGPDYDASMTMIQNSNNGPVPGVADWNEHNPDYTRWYWRYDQAAGGKPGFHLHIRIIVRGALTGIAADIPGGDDTCYQISAESNAVNKMDCPKSGSG
jgi:hypothetical protein